MKPRQPTSLEPEELSFFDSIQPKSNMSRVCNVVFLLILLFLWSSTTTIISGNIVHVCVSSRKLNYLYCLSAGSQKKPDFDITFSLVQNTSVSQEHNVDSNQAVDEPIRDVGKYKNEEVDYAVKSIEEQIRLHRSWASNTHKANCSGEEYMCMIATKV